MKSCHFYILILTCILLTGSCAKMGSITGGLKDEDPPVIVVSKPANYSTNFNGNKIEITFDEFINLNNVNQALVVSPPMKEKPEIRLKGKTLQINLFEDFRENTTYTLNFGNSIEDNNEKNVLENFEFVFATGSFLDSLVIAGSIISAFNLQPSEEPFIIMAYDKLGDSIPMQEIPIYIGRSDKEGKFRINNLKADTFRIFALKDLNFNYIYDLPNESIAFYDSLVYLFPDLLSPYIPDTMTSDTVIQDQDSIIVSKPEKAKNLRRKKKRMNLQLSEEKKYPVLSPYYLDMFFFDENKRKQYLMDSERKEDKHLFLTFNLPLKEDLSLRGLNFDKTNWYYEEANLSRDTFNLWIRDPDLIASDTLIILLSYNSTDSMENIITITDTLSLRSHHVRQMRGKAGPLQKKEGLIVQTIPNNSRQDLHKDLFFHFNYPVDQIDTSRVFLYSIIDSVETTEDFSFRIDPLSLRDHYLLKSWKSNLKYRLFIEPGGFTDIYGHINDSINLNFSAQDADHYGTLLVNTSNVYCPLIIQLMDEKENLFEERFIDSDTIVHFPYLSPGKYRIKYIYDQNGNQQWDTGDYLKKAQPERVAYYEEEISVRSNWEMEIKWKMK